MGVIWVDMGVIWVDMGAETEKLKTFRKAVFITQKLSGWGKSE